MFFTRRKEKELEYQLSCLKDNHDSLMRAHYEARDKITELHSQLDGLAQKLGYEYKRMPPTAGWYKHD